MQALTSSPKNKAQYLRANNGTTPLLIAVKVNEIGLVRYFVEEMKANVDEARDPEEGDAPATERIVPEKGTS